MNPIVQSALEFVKKRWLPVACVGVPVLAVGGMVFASLSMNDSVKQQAQEKINADAKDFTQPNISYKLPGLTPSDAGVEYLGAPNSVTIERFRAARDRQMNQLGGVVAAAIEHNKAGKKPLVDGLFPDPPVGNQVLPRQMARAFNHQAHERLLKLMKAGTPADPTDVANRLRDRTTDFLQRLGPDGTDVARLTPEQSGELAADLLSTRMEAYRNAAQRFVVYATVDAFEIGVMPGDEAVPTMSQCWDWQMIYWVQEDLARAIALTNEPAVNLGVAAATVKRVERVTVLPGATVAASDPNNPAPTVDQSQPDFTVSFTGRRSGPMYDVRKAELVVVVATKDLPRLVDAIGKTNLMTVLGVGLQSVDMGAELARGFYYGPDHVTRATLTVETVWLRGWTEALMPKDVKAGIGILPPDGSGGSGDPGAPGGAPPAPIPVGG